MGPSLFARPFTPSIRHWLSVNPSIDPATQGIKDYDDELILKWLVKIKYASRILTHGRRKGVENINQLFKYLNLAKHLKNEYYLVKSINDNRYVLICVQANIEMFHTLYKLYFEVKLYNYG